MAQDIWKRKDTAALLIAKGANVNYSDLNGQSALHYSVRQGDRDIVELLIAKGADINAAAKDGTTPLQIAKDEGNKEIVELLRKHRTKE